MKLRLLLMGVILALLALVLIGARGFGLAYAGMFVVGIMFLVLGALWNPKPKAPATVGQ